MEDHLAIVLHKYVKVVLLEHIPLQLLQLVFFVIQGIFLHKGQPSAPHVSLEHIPLGKQVLLVPHAQQVDILEHQGHFNVNYALQEHIQLLALMFVILVKKELFQLVELLNVFHVKQELFHLLEHLLAHFVHMELTH